MNTTDKDGIVVEEYKGVYSLISTRAGSDGKQYKQYATYQTGKDKHADKDWPVKVVIGDKETAIKTIAAIYKELTGETIDDGTPF
jgi:hypothetical protein